ncbi:ELM1/GtrOC1 family putative glycosyltransferase [Methylopila sp. 73B]|uniref:ELM1/GtrOC1 family putative glycosyltransferase n=1 Tax=Methylopila sp. 73B TaxID=1120792 RepID=UPI00037C8F57|nr:ELM1/GtrOC1 family putative glycosyltransferase [Methylopila sp. 73B]
MADPEIWALYGRRAGDNRQIATLAEATGLPWRPTPLAFNGLSRRPNLLLGATRLSLTQETKASLSPPWPALVISAGKRSVPAALWIRKASGGRTKLVHIGRPWAPLDWFDLIVTTPQYLLPERPNVIINALPLSRPPAPAPIAEDLAALPGPRLCVIAGGNSRPLIFDAAAARALGAEALRGARESGGSLIVATSPRTSAEATAALQDALADADVPVRLSLFGAGENRYLHFLAAADAFLITDDSAAMVAEGALRGKPVALFRLERRPDRKTRRIELTRRLASISAPTKRLFGALEDAGLLISTRDLDRYVRALADAGFLAGGEAARAHAAGELAETVRRSKALAKAAHPL